MPVCPFVRACTLVSTDLAFVYSYHQASVTYDNSSRSYIMNMTSRDTDKASNYHYKLLERQEAVSEHMSLNSKSVVTCIP